MTETGAAARLADALVDVIGGAGPYALLVGLFLLTAVLGVVAVGLVPVFWRFWV
jgi:di/tricarboxylate transporter